MRKEELIEKYEYLNHDCFRRVDVSEVLGDLKKLDEPQLIKLKDIIARMEGLSEHTRSEWLNDILYKFGSDYGTLKYKAGYEQGKLEGSTIPYEEPQKVTVPQFVADWIEECKNDDFHLFGAMEGISSNQKKLDYWFREDDNMELFARAWLDGYTVEKEKRYLVKMKGISSNMCYLNRVGNKWIIAGIDEHTGMNIYTKHTKKQLEEAGFGWVFDCPGIEIEEVPE